MPISKEDREKMLRNAGMKAANVWLTGAAKGGAEQISQNFEMLKYAAIHVLATYSINIEKFSNEKEVVKEFSKQLDDHVKFLKETNNTQFIKKDE